ncbi:MAG: aldehyde ferredoxin oxidoreductase family protein [Bacillota bacterium]
MFGWTGKMAVIDLTWRTVKYEDIEENLLKNYLGGRGLNAKLLYDMTDAETDPLGPDNPLIFSTGPLTGSLIPTNGRYTVTAKSPLTGIFGDGNSAGFWASELKYAGFDAVVITGNSETPVYIWINNGKAEIKDADHLWGKDVWETDVSLKETWGPNIQAAAIGQAGENQVKYAAIINNGKRAVGRCGMGAVMGAKKLKAVAVRGTQPIKLAHPEEHLKVVDEMLGHIYGAPGYPVRSKLGTTVITDIYIRNGTMPINNAQAAYDERAKNLTSDKIAAYTTGLKGCFACPIHCSRFTRYTEEGPYADAYSEGPEYETIVAVGPRCGNYSLPSILKMNQLLNQYGLDSISTGGVISFLMECSQRGLITKEQVDNLDLSWGNTETIMELVRKIALGEGCGKWLAQGVRKLSQDIKGSEEFAIHVKGLEPAEQEPRGMKAWGLGWAVSNRGADHLRAFPLAETTWTKEDAKRAFGTEDVVNRFEYKGKEKLVKWSEEVSAFTDSLEMCKFAQMALTIPLEMTAKAMWTVTGWEIDQHELLKIGERIVNLERMYNVRLGLGKKDDTLPKRYEEPLKEGASQGQNFEINRLLDQYYAVRGWNVDTGHPTKEKLQELGLNFTIGK